MKLAVGDVVVYGAHGAGLIAARETRDVLGERQVVIGTRRIEYFACTSNPDSAWTIQ